MVTLDARQEPASAAPVVEQSEEKLDGELEEIVKQAAKSATDAPGGPAHWFYTVPFPGARYYTYDEGSGSRLRPVASESAVDPARDDASLN